MEWRGKAYTRAERAGDENARKSAETKERTRWCKRVFKILLDANLPFGTEAEEKGWDEMSPEAGRCFRGLRAASLRKRASDIGPFFR